MYFCVILLNCVKVCDCHIYQKKATYLLTLNDTTVYLFSYGHFWAKPTALYVLRNDWTATFLRVGTPKISSWLKFKLGWDFCTIHLRTKFSHPIFNCSEIIMLSNKQSKTFIKNIHFAHFRRMKRVKRTNTTYVYSSLTPSANTSYMHSPSITSIIKNLLRWKCVICIQTTAKLWINEVHSNQQPTWNTSVSINVAVYTFDHNAIKHRKTFDTQSEKILIRDRCICSELRSKLDRQSHCLRHY